MSSYDFGIRRFLRKSPSVIMEFTVENNGEERTPKWELTKMYTLAESSWVLQQIYRAITQEVKRPGWDVEPKFVLKCNTCGTESAITTKNCKTCDGTDLRPPDPKQYLKALKIINEPNSHRQSFGDILGSIVYHDLVADDWYISVAYAFVKSLKVFKPKEIFVEDPRTFKLISDDRGRLGNNEWFCPVCFPEKSTDIKSKPGKCRKCQGPLKETAYWQKVRGEITNRFARDQVVNGSTYRVLPYLFGNPRLVSLWEIVQTLRYIDAWYHDSYKTGRVSKIINFPGYKPDEVKAVSKMIRESEQRMNSADPLRGLARPERRLKTAFIGSNTPIGVHDIMPSPDKMGALDFYKNGIQGICGVYGVQAIFISYVEGGKAGTTPAMQIEVQNRTIEEIQRDKEEVITLQLFPIFGIHDYKFVFGDLEKKDEMRDVQIMQIRANTAKTWVDAGFTVKILDDGEIEVTGVGKKTETMRPTGPTEQKDKESGASGREINGTTTERGPHGTRESAPDVQDGSK
jgi:hypothetical protein